MTRTCSTSPRCFSSWRYNVVTANSGQQALDLMSQLRPQLILLDVMMPGIDGAEVLRQVRANAQLRGVPVAVFSAAEARASTSCATPAPTISSSSPTRWRASANTVRELIDKAARSGKRSGKKR